MSIFLMLLIGITVLLVVVPVTAIMIFWLKSYNRLGIIYREVGDNPNQAHRQLKKFKIKKQKGLGQFIHFLFTTLPDTKSFSSKHWYYVQDGKKTLMGVPLYLQRDTFRPLVLNKEKICLEPENIDSREFKLRSFVHNYGNYENNKLYFAAIGAFIIFMIVLGVAYAFSNYYLTTDVARAVVSNTPAPIQIG